MIKDEFYHAHFIHLKKDSNSHMTTRLSYGYKHFGLSIQFYIKQFIHKNHSVYMTHFICVKRTL